MKYDRLYNFISPVTGKLPLDRGYVLLGDKEGRSFASPVLIDVRQDIIDLKRKIGNFEELKKLDHNQIWIGDYDNEAYPQLHIGIINLPPLAEAVFPNPISPIIGDFRIPNPTFDYTSAFDWVMSGPFLPQIYATKYNALGNPIGTDISSSLAMTQVRAAQIMKRFDNANFIVGSSVVEFNWENPKMALIPEPLKQLYGLGTTYTFTKAQSLGSLQTGLLKNTVNDGTGTLSKAISGEDYVNTANISIGKLVILDHLYPLTGHKLIAPTDFSTRGNNPDEFGYPIANTINILTGIASSFTKLAITGITAGSLIKVNEYGELKEATANIDYNTPSALNEVISALSVLQTSYNSFVTETGIKNVAQDNSINIAQNTATTAQNTATTAQNTAITAEESVATLGATVEAQISAITGYGTLALLTEFLISIGWTAGYSEYLWDKYKPLRTINRYSDTDDYDKQAGNIWFDANHVGASGSFKPGLRITSWDSSVAFTNDLFPVSMGLFGYKNQTGYIPIQEGFVFQSYMENNSSHGHYRLPKNFGMYYVGHDKGQIGWNRRETLLMEYNYYNDKFYYEKAVDFKSYVRFQDTGALKISVGNTSERPSILEIGLIRFNVDLMKLEFPVYNGLFWEWQQSATEDFVNAKVFNINSNTSGQLNINRLNGYPASSSVFLRGDGTWATPAGSGTVTSVGISGSTGLSVSGSPITTDGTINLTLNSTLQALSTLPSFSLGLLTRTGFDDYELRTLTAGTGIVIINSDGVSGNPTVSLSNTAVTSGTYPYPSNLTVNAQGQLTSVTAGSPPITSLTLTGAVTGSGTNSIATTLNTTQTIGSSLFNINWTDTVASSKLVKHSLLDSSPLASSNPQFISRVEIGSEASLTRRQWSLYYKGGIPSSPIGANFTIGYFHDTIGERIPLTIICTGTGGFDFVTTLLGSLSVKGTLDLNSNKIIGLSTPTLSTDGVNKSYADSLITPQLSALSTLATTGLMVRTGSNTFTTRTITAGTGISISNGSGVSGNPTINLGTVPISSLSGYPTNSSLYLRGDGIWSSLLPLNLYTSNLTDSITIYNSNNSSYASGFRALNQNTGYGVEFGLNNSTSEAYVFAGTTLSLKFGTNGIMRMKINSNGSIDCQSNDIKTTGTISAGTISAGNGTLETNNLDTYSSTAIVCSPLAVTSFYGPFTGNYGYLNASGNTGTASNPSLYSINATYRIKASEFNAVSSIKKKHVLAQGIEIEKEVVEIIKKTEFFKYEYKDQIVEKGIRYGVIAEELAKTLPDYVEYDNMEYIPNIMQLGILQKIKNTKYQYILSSENEIEISTKIKKLKLINNQNKVFEVEISGILDTRTLKINAKEEISEKVFIYGTYEQCPSVVSKVTELALIGVKNLLTRIENLEKKLL